jgi:hypothetical protein
MKPGLTLFCISLEEKRNQLAEIKFVIKGGAKSSELFILSSLAYYSKTVAFLRIKTGRKQSYKRSFNTKETNETLITQHSNKVAFIQFIIIHQSFKIYMQNKHHQKTKKSVLYYNNL